MEELYESFERIERLDDEYVASVENELKRNESEIRRLDDINKFNRAEIKKNKEDIKRLEDMDKFNKSELKKSREEIKRLNNLYQSSAKHAKELGELLGNRDIKKSNEMRQESNLKHTLEITENKLVEAQKSLVFLSKTMSENEKSKKSCFGFF